MVNRQTILGAGGAIGIELAKSLRSFTGRIRLVSRNPEKVNESDELFNADLTNPEGVMKAAEGSEIVYLTAGLTYSTKIWATQWPVIVRNVISACRSNNARLVFFDNIYMYDPDYLDRMDENTPVNPCSKKGKIRAYLADTIMNDVRKGNLDALIVRSADFYGPSIKTSILTETVFKNFSDGKKALWLVSDKHKHSFTYTPDAGKATAILGNTPEAYNQVWHLPTASSPLTGKEWIEAIAKEMDVRPEYRVIPRFMIKLIGLFVPVMRETTEMLYQFDRDYIFSSSKFEKHFNVKPTPYLEGVKHIVKKDYSKD